VNRFAAIAERITAKIDESLAFELSQTMWKAKAAIEKATHKALSSNNSEAMDMLDRAWKPLKEMMTFLNWQFLKYSDPLTNMSEQQAHRLLDSAKDTLQIVKKITSVFGLR
jgi:hypothetical protein